MKTAATFSLILCTNAVSAFQLNHGTASRLNGGIYGSAVSRGVELNNAADGTSSEGALFNVNDDDDADPSVFTRQSFLAKALVASTLPSLIATAPAFAAEIAAPPAGAAIYAYRAGGLPSLRALGFTKLLTRYEGYVEAPKSYSKSQIGMAFEFPTDWLQLDKLGGGVQYVDQRNGDKCYVLHATLPEGSDLKTVNKQWFADVILSPQGDVARSGVVAEGGRVSRSQNILDCTAEDAPTPCMPRRRLIVKYDTVTGSGVQTVERRGLVDAYQVDNDVYMMFTTSNAVKFEQKGKERETVDNIAASFTIGAGAFI